MTAAGDPVSPEIPAFFSYAHRDDDEYSIVSKFYERFKVVLESKGHSKILPFLDRVDMEQYGKLDDSLKDRINRTRILFIFLGRFYAKSEFCFKEWEWFCKRHSTDFRSRIFIVELRNDALEMVEDTGQQALLKSNIRIEWYNRTSGGKFEPLTPSIQHENGKAVNNPNFRLKVEEVANDFMKAFERVGGSDPVGPAPPSSVHSADFRTSRNLATVAGERDVVIGLATRDIKEAVGQLQERLEKSFGVHSISHEDYAEGRDVYGPHLQAAKLVVLSFSWYGVFSSDGPDGGHLAAQRACIAEGSKVLWWCPPGGVAPDGTFGTSLLGENGRRHLDYLVARAREASYAMPEVLVGEIKQRLSPPSPSRWAPQIALEIRSPYEDETKRLRDFLRELWRQKLGEPVPEIQATELQPTEDLADLAGVADGILLAAVGKPNASVTAQVMILKKSLLKLMDEPPKWGLFTFRPPADAKGILEPPPPCYVLLGAEATDTGLELKAEATEITDLTQFLYQVRTVAERRRQNGAAGGQT